MKTFFAAFIFVLLLASAPAALQAQQNFYVGIVPMGPGCTFTKVGWRDPNNRTNLLHSAASISFTGGIKARYNINKKLSLQTGIMATRRTYRALFPKEEDFGIFLIFQRLGYTRLHATDITLPFEVVARMPINEKRKLYASFTGGLGLNLSVKRNETSERAAYYDRFFASDQDSAALSFFSFQHKRAPVQGMLILGIGIEKEVNNTLISFSIVSYTGFSRVYKGDFYFYDTPIHHVGDNGRFPTVDALPPQQWAEHDKVFSRNSSIMLQLGFLFATKNRVEKDKSPYRL